ncbi:MAG: hypothetical protein IT577_14290 [Verrucomicrobiae bacterium]|nr:hypothetical protein [Verrucomicrobiae bacterium]
MRALSHILMLVGALSAAMAQPSPPRETPAPDKAPQDKDKPARPPHQPDGKPFDDPLARQKLDDDLWITKGLQGGFKTDELWILQSPSGPNPGSGDSGGERDQNPSKFGAWPGSQAPRDPNRPAELSDQERMRLFQEWERFVFGEPKDSRGRSPFADAPRRSGTRDDEASPGTKAPTPPADSPGIGLRDTGIDPLAQGGFTLGTQPPDPLARPRADTTEPKPPFSSFGAQPVPGLRSEDWFPNNSPSSPQALGTAPFPNPQYPAGTIPPAFGAPQPSTPSPFNTQIPGMGFGLPQNSLQIPGGPQGPVPTPRAHSTDSFMKREPW